MEQDVGGQLAWGQLEGVTGCTFNGLRQEGLLIGAR